MTTDYNPNEAQRLIAEARDVGYPMSGRLADQLEAAGREVERLNTTAAISDAGARWHAADNKRLTAKRDSLRQQLEAAGKLLETECKLSMNTTNAMLRAQSDLAAAQRRIAELEADLKAAPPPGVALDLERAEMEAK